MRNLKVEAILMSLAVLLLACIFVTIFRFGSSLEPAETATIGFVLTGGAHDTGWNGTHYKAMRNVCGQMGARLLVKEDVQENVGECPRAIRELAAAGSGMIFLTSFAYPQEAKDVVGDYPGIAFGTISAEYTARNMTACFVRLYQGRYLSGILAGMRTRSNVIGYVAAMPNSEVNRGINAFTLGVQSVNPAAKVVVCWTGSWQDNAKEAANARRLVQEAGADVLAYHQNQRAVADTAEALGVDFIGYHEPLTGYSDHCLTSVVCRWEAYYTDIVRRYLKGELNAEDVHWMGLEEGAVYLGPYSSAVTEEMRERVERERQRLLDGHLVFSGEIYDNKGHLQCGTDEILSDDILLEHVDWLVRGVETLD